MRFQDFYAGFWHIANMKRVVKPIFIILGYVCVGLGILGAFLPLLPTTPFGLLAAYFFSKGSPKLYSWVISMPLLGPSIQDWNEYGVIPRKVKLIAVLSILSVMYMIWLRPIPWWGKGSAYLILVSVIIFVSSRKEHRIKTMGHHPKA